MVLSESQLLIVKFSGFNKLLICEPFLREQRWLVLLGQSENPVYDLAIELTNVHNKHYDKDVARGKLALWYNKIEKLGYGCFRTVTNTMQNYYETILNYFVNRETNAFAESFNAKIKAFRAQFRGVGDIPFFIFRLCKLTA